VRRRAAGERGFTLLEVLLALLITATAIAMLQAISNGSLKDAAETGKVRVAKMLLRSKLEEILAGIETGTGGEFEGYPGYSWEAREEELQAGEQESVRAIEVTIRYPTLRGAGNAVEGDLDGPGTIRAAVYVDPPGAKLEPPKGAGTGAQPAGGGATPN
jgi:prepilin-type N-terminal cleavage/methylation domain-containing protein